MENMFLDGFGVSNFKCFDEKIKIAQRPITINIGPNNSGKSSLIKAVRLIHHSLTNDNFTKRNRHDLILPEIDSFHLQNFGEPENYLNDPSKELSFSIPVIFEVKPKWLLNKTVEITFQYLFIDDYQSDIDYTNLLKGGKRVKRPPGLGKLNKYQIYIDNKKFIEVSRKLQVENIYDNTDFGYYGELKIHKLNSNEQNKDEVLILPIEIPSRYFYNINKIVQLISNALVKNEYRDVDLIKYLFSTGLDSIETFQDYISKIAFIDLDRREYGRSFDTSKSKLFKDFYEFYFDRKQSNIVTVKKFLKKVLLLFNISSDIEIEPISDNGFSIHLIDNDGKKRNIVDFGSGINQLLPLLLFYSTKINSSVQYHRTHLKYNLSYLNSLIIVEEPESNFHPSFQSKLADLFTLLLKERNLNFIIETHSEYLIRKFQYLTAIKKINTNEIAINYFWKTDYSHKCKQIEFNESGGLTKPFENGFFDESYNLKHKLLRIKNLN